MTRMLPRLLPAQSPSCFVISLQGFCVHKSSSDECVFPEGLTHILVLPLYLSLVTWTEGETQLVEMIQKPRKVLDTRTQANPSPFEAKTRALKFSLLICHCLLTTESLWKAALMW